MKKNLSFIMLQFFLLLFVGCNQNFISGQKPANIEKKGFGQMPDGREVYLFTLTNNNGLKAGFINYGAIVTALYVPDRNGKLDDIVLGYDSLEEYLKDIHAFGAIIGRCTNKIDQGKFTLNGKQYQLTTQGKHHKHGGNKGFRRVYWDAVASVTKEGPAVKFSYLSKDGEEGYPGNLNVAIIYTLTNDNELKVDYEAVTDRPTIVNMTQHSYFNLAGQGSGDCLNHEMTIYADHFTPFGKNNVPTGEIKSLKRTPLDFTKTRSIGSRIKELDLGYHYYYVFNKPNGPFDIVARTYEPTTARIMDRSINKKQSRRHR